MNIDKINELNLIYKPLYDSAVNLTKELAENDFTFRWGYYGLHSVKHNDNFVTEFFPIPVITIIDICDIGLNLDHVFFETKLARCDALSFDYSFLKEYNFEVYGVEDYQLDFYNNSLNYEIKNMKTSVDLLPTLVFIFFT